MQVWWDRRRGDVFWFAVAVLLAVVFVHLRRTTAGLQWPHDVDLYRDIGQAAAVQRGHWIADAAYPEEVAWYNPLLSWVVAALATGLDAPVATIGTRGGVVLNLLGPIALTALVARLFGRLEAGFALVAFIFLMCGNWPSWAVATYSPWLFQANVAQGLFYLGLLALARAVQDPRPLNTLMFAALLGLVALTHTAPALLLVVIFLATATWQAHRDRRSAGSVARTVAFAGAVAAIVASPFLGPLAWRYRFRVQNPMPPAGCGRSSRPDGSAASSAIWSCAGRCCWRSSAV